jgi:hypothetical protein
MSIQSKLLIEVCLLLNPLIAYVLQINPDYESSIPLGDFSLNLKKHDTRMNVFTRKRSMFTSPLRQTPAVVEVLQP